MKVKDAGFPILAMAAVIFFASPLLAAAPGLLQGLPEPVDTGPLGRLGQA